MSNKREIKLEKGDIYMGFIITFVNEKGGVGKTSCCYNMAWELANMKKNVLMIDMDGQRSNLTYYAGIEKNEDTLTMADLLRKNVNPSEAVQKVKDNLFIVPATQDVTNIGSTVKLKKMKDVIAALERHYDYVFIDVSPSPDYRHLLSLSISDYALIIMLPDMASVEADNGIIETIEEVREVANQYLKVAGILFNRNEMRSNMGSIVRKLANEISTKLNTKVFKNSIRNAVAIGEVAYMHEGITDYDSNSKVADDVRKVVKEFIKEVG